MKEKKKIKVLLLIFHMGAGGAQRIILNYLNDLSNDDDIELVLGVYANNDNSYCNKIIRENGYNVIYLNLPRSKITIPKIKNFFNRRIAEECWQDLIKKCNPDIVHVHITGLLYSTMRPIIACNVPVRFDTLHSSPFVYKGQVLKTIRRAFQREKFIPICVTKEQAQIAKKRYGFNRYEIVKNGIDFEEIRKKIISQEEARKLYNIPKDTFLVIGVGRLHKVKNYNLLIKSFNTMLAEKENSMLLIAGSGSELNNLKKLVNKLSLNDKVRFLGEQNNIIPLYCAADVLGLTSKSESSSLVLIEAQYCGLRCVISNNVPDESIVTEKVQKMQKNATSDEWAKALLDVNYKGKIVCNINEYELHNSTKRMKEIYLKYWKEYVDGQK